MPWTARFKVVGRTALGVLLEHAENGRQIWWPLPRSTHPVIGNWPPDGTIMELEGSRFPLRSRVIYPGREPTIWEWIYGCDLPDEMRAFVEEMNARHAGAGASAS